MHHSEEMIDISNEENVRHCQLCERSEFWQCSERVLKYHQIEACAKGISFVTFLFAPEKKSKISFDLGDGLIENAIEGGVTTGASNVAYGVVSKWDKGWENAWSNFTSGFGEGAMGSVVADVWEEATRPQTYNWYGHEISAKEYDKLMARRRIRDAESISVTDAWSSFSDYGNMMFRLNGIPLPPERKPELHLAPIEKAYNFVVDDLNNWMTPFVLRGARAITYLHPSFNSAGIAIDGLIQYYDNTPPGMQWPKKIEPHY